MSWTRVSLVVHARWLRYVRTFMQPGVRKTFFTPHSLPSPAWRTGLSPRRRRTNAVDRSATAWGSTSRPSTASRGNATRTAGRCAYDAMRTIPSPSLKYKSGVVRGSPLRAPVVVSSRTGVKPMVDTRPRVSLTSVGSTRRETFFRNHVPARVRAMGVITRFRSDGGALGSTYGIGTREIVPQPIEQWRRPESNRGPRPREHSFYERSQASGSRLLLANLAGLEEASPLRCRSSGEDGRRSLSPFLMPAIRPTGRGRANSSLA